MTTTSDKVSVGIGTLPNGLPAATADTKDPRDPQQWKGLRAITEDKSMPLPNRTTTWTRKRHYEFFDWISARPRNTIETKWEISDLHVRAKAWRKAVVAWLCCQKLINVSRKPKPLLHFNPQKRS